MMDDVHRQSFYEQMKHSHVLTAAAGVLVDGGCTKCRIVTPETTGSHPARTDTLAENKFGVCKYFVDMLSISIVVTCRTY